MFRGPRVVGSTVAVVAIAMIPLVPTAASAPAPGPVAGADYKGRIAGAPHDQGKVRFTVSDDGRSVTMTLVGPWALSLECGSGGDVPAQSSERAPIKKNRFTAHVLYTATDDTVIARTTVTGRFLQDGKEKGVVTTVMEGLANCPRHSLPYTARAE